MTLAFTQGPINHLRLTCVCARQGPGPPPPPPHSRSLVPSSHVLEDSSLLSEQPQGLHQNQLTLPAGLFLGSLLCDSLASTLEGLGSCLSEFGADCKEISWDEKRHGGGGGTRSRKASLEAVLLSRAGC